MTTKLTMEVKLGLCSVLFATCFWFVDGCNRQNTYNCHGTCHFHRKRRSSDNYKMGQNGTAELSRTYSIMLQGDPCNFNTYDADGDGAIAKGELHAVLCINEETDALFADLNVMADDGVIKLDEFLAMGPLIITECLNSNKL